MAARSQGCRFRPRDQSGPRRLGDQDQGSSIGGMADGSATPYRRLFRSSPRSVALSRSGCPLLGWTLPSDRGWRCRTARRALGLAGNVSRDSLEKRSAGACRVRLVKVQGVQVSRVRGTGTDRQRKETPGEDARRRKTSSGGVDKAFAETPKVFYLQSEKELDACLSVLRSLDELCTEKFGHVAPSFGRLKIGLEEVRHTVHALAGKEERDRT